MKLDLKAASADALEAVKSKTGRVCPVACESGYRADGDRCVKIACRTGYQLGQDNKCQRIERSNIANRPNDQRVPETQAAPRLASPSGLARADAAHEKGTYQSCMGARSGCYERSISGLYRGDPEGARRWCSRRPTC